MAWLTPTLGTVDQLQAIDAQPVNLREETCGSHRKRPAAEDEEVEVSGASGTGDSPLSFLLNSSSTVKLSHVLAQPSVQLPPVDVYVGTTKPASVAAAEAQESQLVGGGKHGKKKAKGKAKTKTAEANAKAATTSSAETRAKPKKAPAAKPASAKPKPAAAAAPSVKTAASPSSAPQR
jgi:D-alanyl-D-alanine carboxypeptidase